MRESQINKYIPLMKVQVEKRIVTGIVLEPERVDLQGDIYDADTIEESAHNFLKDVRQMGVMHKQFGKDLHVVESYIAPVDFELEGKKIKKGTWLLAAKVMDDAIWNAIKNKEITGFSIGAVAQYEGV
jgi:DNA adenine methylase